jgi:hypothetical protein
VCRINEFSTQVLRLGVEDPAYTPIVYGHADERTKKLREKNGSGRDMHVVPDSERLKSQQSLSGRNISVELVPLM